MKMKTVITLSEEDVKTAVKEFVAKQGFDVLTVNSCIEMELQGYGMHERGVPTFKGMECEVQLMQKGDVV